MRKVNRSALVPHSADEMFTLVDDIEAYPSFLPWCNDARIHHRSTDTVEATLELHRGSLSKRFTTRNSLCRPERIDLALVGGPFRHLSGGWAFADLGAAGSKVSLELDFEFESMLLDLMFGSFFEDTCNALVDAFTRRALVVYGGP